MSNIRYAVTMQTGDGNQFIVECLDSWTRNQVIFNIKKYNSRYLHARVVGLWRIKFKPKISSYQQKKSIMRGNF